MRCPTDDGIRSASAITASGSSVPSARIGRLVEGVPEGALRRRGHERLPRRAPDHRPALDPLPERERLAVVELDLRGRRVAERRGAGGSRHVGHGQVGELEPRPGPPEHRHRGVARIGPGRPGRGRDLRHRAPPAQDRHVDRDLARGDHGREHRGLRAQPLLGIAQLEGHRRGGQGGHRPALGDRRAVPARVDVDVVAARLVRIGLQPRHLVRVGGGAHASSVARPLRPTGVDFGVMNPGLAPLKTVDRHTRAGGPTRELVRD